MDLREITEFFRDFMWYIIAILVIIIVVTFIVAFQPVAGNSMNPTLKDGQIVLVSKISYIISNPQRNQIAVLNHNGKSYIKRIIGLPGEKIEYMDDILYINDEPFKESYLGENIKTYNFLFKDVCSLEDCPDSVIPFDKYLVMGDNREESEDSRSPKFGLVDRKDLKGKLIFSIYPFKSVK